MHMLSKVTLCEGTGRELFIQGIVALEARVWAENNIPLVTI